MVMVSSRDAKTDLGLVATPSYGAAKAYLNAYIRGIASSLAANGIIVSGIMPGPIIADGNAWQRRYDEMPDKVSAYIQQNLPNGRLGTPDDLCPFVVLLASNANTWGVGVVISLDGGSPWEKGLLRIL